MPNKKVSSKKKDQVVTLDEWEEAVSGNYYDRNQSISKVDEKVLRKLSYWQNYKPSNWIGHWYKNCQVKKLENKVDHYNRQRNK